MRPSATTRSTWRAKLASKEEITGSRWRVASRFRWRGPGWEACWAAPGSRSGREISGCRCGNDPGRLHDFVHGDPFVGRVFFQAEDGIRDLTVTGVQTCALPI